MRSVQQSILDAVMQLKPLPVALLDVGCGTGAFTLALSSCLPNTTVTGLDRTHPRYFSGASNLRFAQGSVEELPFAAESFDAVIASLSMHHWNDIKKGIREIFRVLRGDGHLIIGDPLLMGWMSNRTLGRLMQRIDGGVFAQPQELKTHLTEAGFESATIEVVPHSMGSQFLIRAHKP